MNLFPKRARFKNIQRTKKTNYKGVIRFSGFVEPLLDKKIYNHISLIKKYVPRVELKL